MKEHSIDCLGMILEYLIENNKVRLKSAFCTAIRSTYIVAVLRELIFFIKALTARTAGDTQLMQL